MNEPLKNAKPSVLIVDDDRNTCRGIARALSGVYEVFTASDGYEALEVLDQNCDIQIILTDITMSEMNGLELLEKIHFQCKKKVVIIMSGLTECKALEEAKNLGAYDYLTKPVDLNKLEASIHNAFETIGYN